LRYRLNEVNPIFEYQSMTMPQPAILDIKEEYRKLGGKITEETLIEFDKYFPEIPYLKTALTPKMRNGYPCEGSITVYLINPNQTDTLSLSSYRHIEDNHRNLFLQHEINGIRNHSKKINDRHISFNEDLVIKAKVDDFVVCTCNLSAIVKKNE